ncbi:hypothetical protein BTJ40_10655 [Microbulbifer sp. A4B17]|uniref:hypothetical protein n=1 Tax=Microbulbifer sp. A4B17 TaxID=359370 RepID=UPI000D52CFFF|nr:hypothetical protein [Microbulbifer sp. A4B17]AWF81242.1 hypothetical protein BTJ40_10655 [Microbulbifer sp. A4B17]
MNNPIYPQPHEDPLTVGSTLSTVAGVTLAGNKTFMASWNQRLPLTPIKYEYIGMYSYGTKLQGAKYLKYGGNALGAAGYRVSAYSYYGSMSFGNYRDARKYAVDGFMGALMFAWSVGTAVGGIGFYVNQDYHSNPHNP